MTIKEKMLKIIALAMSIKATDSYFLAIDWNNKTDHVIICVHKHIDGRSQGVVESYIYDGVEEVTGYGSYVTYDDMIDRLNRIQREWGTAMDNTIKLTDTDGIIFELDINMISGVLGINRSDPCTEISIISGSKITVKETAMDVMQMIVSARFGI